MYREQHRLKFELTKPESSGRTSTKSNHVCSFAKQRNRRNHMNKQNSDRIDLDHSITRRKFLGTTALSSAALLSGGIHFARFTICFSCG